jgi:glycosyltransferase involved in cell wall biosynthesis
MRDRSVPETSVRVAFAIPGDIDLPTGGYAYDRRVLALLPEMGIDIEHAPLPRAFPRPSGMDLCTTAQVLAGAPSETVMLIDGLAYGAFSAATLASIPHKIVALVHHPLAFETGIGPERASALLASETAALARANHVIVTSATTGEILQANFAVPHEKITVAEPGTDEAPRSTGTGSPLQLLAVGSIVPRKAYPVLIDALRDLAAPDWHLTIAGAARDAQELAQVEAAIASTALADRITLAGTVDDATLAALYDKADLFVMSSLFEGYGMVLAEAMARGLPIVCTTGGAAAEVVPEGAAIKVLPGDVRALETALRQALGDAKLRKTLADASWIGTARIIADVIKDVAR